MRIAVPAIEPMFTDHDMNAPPVAGRDDSRRGKHGVAVTQVPGWRPLPGTRKSIVLIDRTMIALQAFLRVDTPAACALFWDGERITSLRTLAIGERVGKAGPDLFRSPMRRCSHARFPRRESYGARSARCFES